MRTFDIHYENGSFCHSSLVKAVRNRQSKQMKIWKLEFQTVRQMKFKNFLNFVFTMTAKN